MLKTIFFSYFCAINKSLHLNENNPYRRRTDCRAALYHCNQRLHRAYQTLHFFRYGGNSRIEKYEKPDTRATEREGRRTDSQSPSAGRRGCVAGRTRKRDAVGGVCPLDGEEVGKRQQTPGIYYRRTLWLFTKGI